MSGPSPAPPTPRTGRRLAVAFLLALAGFTFLCWRDAGRPPVRPVSGGTFVGQDVDGRLVQVCLFDQDEGWQGWLYREGRVQTDWFSTTNRNPPWQATVTGRESDVAPKPPESVIASTTNVLKLNATLPRLASWGVDTANLSRQFEHLSFRRRTGLKLGRYGGTKEFHAQFPKLPAGTPIFARVNALMLERCEMESREFTGGIFAHLKEGYELDWPATMSEWALTKNWQLRLLTTRLVSFCVWSYDETGGNGNHSHWAGENFVLTEDGLLHTVNLADLFRPETDWQHALRVGCVPKLKATSAPRPEAVLNKDVALDVFTLSPTGLQIYFNPYAIASGADGEFVVHFDYGELKDLLRTNGPALFLPYAPAEAAK
ncbi:MAG: DUF3298 domain-containing protein [Proteobacteria bacterium]|nr:DUF3298 domain-containing protein [Pseudomonadota bacterium]